MNSKNPYASYTIDNNILFGVYEQGAEVDLEAAKFLVEERIKLAQGKDYLFLVDLRNLKSATKDARRYFSSEAGSEGIIAGAFLVDSFLSKLIGNFYLKIYPPPRPTRLFTECEEAVRWLKTFSQN